MVHGVDGGDTMAERLSRPPPVYQFALFELHPHLSLSAMRIYYLYERTMRSSTTA